MKAKPDIEKCGWVFIDLLESEAIDDVISGSRNIVVDMDLIPDVFPEGEIIGASIRQFRRDIIRDNGDHIRIIRAPESVEVGIVCQWIVGDQGSLPMAGCEQGKREAAKDQA